MFALFYTLINNVRVILGHPVYMALIGSNGPRWLMSVRCRALMANASFWTHVDLW